MRFAHDCPRSLSWRRVRFVASAAAILLCLVAGVAQAQPAFSESFFIAPAEGRGEEASAVNSCGQTFRQPLLQSGAFIERQTVTGDGVTSMISSRLRLVRSVP